MAYFTELPAILYQFPDDVVRQYNNLAFRPAIIDTIIQNSSNFAYYTVQDGDTPETIAYDYYGDAALQWVLLLTNNITNYYTQWPKTRLTFEKYLLGKYRQVLDSDGVLVTLDDAQVMEYVNGITGDIVVVVDSEVHIVRLHPLYYEDAQGVRYTWQFIENEEPARNAYGQLIEKPINPFPVSIFTDEDRANTAMRNIILLKQSVISEIQYELRNLAIGQQ